MRNPSKVIGIMADPGLPQKSLQSAADELAETLREEVDDTIDWRVDVSREAFSLTPDGDIPLMDEAEDLRRRYQWDLVIYLTELPRYLDEDPLLCELSVSNRAALVSLPAMGARRLSARIRKLLVVLIQAAQHDDPGSNLVENGHSELHMKSLRAVPDAEADGVNIILPGWWSRVRLLSGMVRHNRPGGMLPAMSGSLAAAIAFGTFGVYYSSVWLLAAALHPLRLLLISVVIVAVLTGWFIFRNGLWNSQKTDAPTWRGRFDNLTTIIMVGTSVALMYLFLAIGLFGFALLIIDSRHLSTELLQPINIWDYVEVAWMAAGLGSMAGALGSTFDSDEKIRRATYSNREHARRKLSDAYNDSYSEENDVDDEAARR